MNTLYVAFVNRKTDEYGANSSVVIVSAETETQAKEQVTAQLGPNKWVSGVKEASFVFVANEKQVGLVDGQGQKIHF
jgi:hypothetical protein